MTFRIKGLLERLRIKDILCHYAECQTERRVLFIVMLNAIMLSVVTSLYWIAFVPSAVLLKIGSTLVAVPLKGPREENMDLSYVVFQTH